MVALAQWVSAHPTLLWTAGTLSVITFVGSLILVPWLVLQVPADYFLGATRAEHRPRFRHPGLRIATLVIKNLLGGLLLLAGLAMLFIPGQGLLTLFMGLMLLDYPGKYRLEKRIVRTPVILHAMNWIREHRGRAPIRVSGDRG